MQFMKSYFTKKKFLSLLTLIALIIGGVSAKHYKNSPPVVSATPNTQKHDFLFVMSWSPAYCHERDPNGRQAQCYKKLPKQYRFIVHGLWPQGNPQNGKANNNQLSFCQKTDPKLEASIVTDYFYLMPSSGLMAHQWKKHASCGNFTQQSYFKTIETLYQRFNGKALFADITKTQSFSLDALIDKITAKMPNISPHISKENIVIRCRQSQLKEIRICLNSDYSPRQCRYSEVKSGGCRRNQNIMVRI
ncbi:MAG: ribonuclease T2 [Dasania sp.]|jgi:ribonuclease T2